MENKIKEIRKRLSNVRRDDNGVLTSDGWISYAILLKNAEADIETLLSLLNQAHKEIEELKANELKFPTLSEFSNLQDDLEKEKEKNKQHEE